MGLYKIIKKIFFLSLCAFICSCGTSSLTVSMMRPADITIPQHINNLVIANRTAPTKGNLGSNIVEGVFTGEGIGADNKASNYCVNGLNSIMKKSQRYKLLNPASMQLKGTGTSVFSPPLKWKKIKTICSSYNNADALIVLETFDSDSRIIDGKPVKRIVKIKGKKVSKLHYPVTLVMEIESGWRIYDVKNEVIIDESKFTEIKEFKAWGVNPKDARLNLPNQMSALKESGIRAGEKFGLRITPVRVNAKRTYYTGKNVGLKETKKYVEVGNWKRAIEIWKKLSSNADKEISSKACYNMALACEVKGALDSAIDWAVKSRDLGNKRAKSYILSLRKRKLDEEKLKQQLIK